LDALLFPIVIFLVGTYTYVVDDFKVTQVCTGWCKTKLMESVEYKVF